jgi:hypothetical protein
MKQTSDPLRGSLAGGVDWEGSPSILLLPGSVAQVGFARFVLFCKSKFMPGLNFVMRLQ